MIMASTLTAISHAFDVSVFLLMLLVYICTLTVLTVVNVFRRGVLRLRPSQPTVDPVTSPEP